MVNVPLDVCTMLGYVMRTKAKNYFKAKPSLDDTGLSEALYRVGWLVAEDLENRQLESAVKISDNAERYGGHE